MRLRRIMCFYPTNVAKSRSGILRRYIEKNILGMEVRDYEKSSYGGYAYRRVQRLRKRGEKRGIFVPALEYELTKPDKRRTAFWITAIVSAAIFAGITAGLWLLYNEIIKIFSDLGGLFRFMRYVFNPDVLFGSFGLSALPGILMAGMYILIFVLLSVPFSSAVYFYRLVRDAYYMSHCSKEEFAKGEIVASRMFSLAVFLTAITILLIVLLAYISVASAMIYIGLIYGGLAAVLGTLLALILIERTKSSKWFDTLDESKKQSYLAHESALRMAKSRARKPYAQRFDD